MDGGVTDGFDIETIDLSTKSLPPQNMEVVDKQLFRFDRASIGHHNWAENRGANDHLYGARECVKQLEGEQWKPEDIDTITGEGRAVISINKIARLFRLVVGYQRQNRFEPQVEPTDDSMTDYYTADLLSHLMKNDLDRNRFGHVESQVFADGMTTGRGYFDIRLDYSKNIQGDVKITARDPFRIYIDPDAAEYDPESWNYVIESSWMSRESILMAFGIEAYLQTSNAPMETSRQSQTSVDDGDDPGPKSTFGLDRWFDGWTNTQQYFSPKNSQYLISEHYDKGQRLLRVLSGQHRELKRVKYLLEPETGMMVEIHDEIDQQTLAGMIQWAQGQGVQLKMVTRIEKRIRWVVTAGDLLLHDDWSPYDRFTIVPYFAYFRRGVTRGLVHDLIDPQREINKRRASIIHIITTTANSGWQIEKGSLSPEEVSKIENEGAAPGYLQFYEKGTTPPKKIDPSIPPAAIERLEQSASNDLKEVSGINESSLGEQDNAQSGVAVENRQRQTVVGLEMYLDNLNLTRSILGQAHVEIMQRYYKAPRILRQMNLVGQPNDVTINEIGAAGQIQNDIGVGRYHLTVNSVSAQDTFAKRQFQQLKEMVQLGIIPPQLAAPQMIDVSDIPFKPQLKAMLQMVQASIVQPPAPAGAGAPPAAGAPQ